MKRTKPIEWPSLLLCGGLYSCFLMLTWFYADLPMAATIGAGAVLIAWQSSMQHDSSMAIRHPPAG